MSEMTAKQMAENCKSEAKCIEDGFGNVLAYDPQYTFDENEFLQFCDQLCREQRELCAAECHYYQDEIKVLNAKQPEI